MPAHVVSLVTDALNDRGRAVRGASILVLGVTYKADVNDIRESPALEIVETRSTAPANSDRSTFMILSFPCGMTRT